VKVLALTKYDDSVASSRQRFSQFFPALRARGVTVDHCPLWPRSHVDRFFAGQGVDPWGEAGAYVARVRGLVEDVDADVWWIEGELLPFVPAELEPRPRAHVRVVIDYDDAVFHKYDMSRHGFVRSILGDKIARVMGGADLVIAGNDYIAAYAHAAGARAVRVVPTVVDLARYVVAGRVARPFTVGWIGTPHTAQYLDTVLGALRAVVDDGGDVRLVGVGAPPAGLRATCVPWNADTEVAEIGQFDVGIMPLPDTPWERGKCAYKLIQYMACGVPVVASDVGVNRVVVGDAGLIVGQGMDWLAALRKIRDDPAVRKRAATEARRRVTETFSKDGVAEQLVDAVLGVVGKTRRLAVD